MDNIYKGLMFESKETNINRHKYDASPYASSYKIQRLVASGVRVLDVGCSSGYIAEKMVSNNCEVYGIEVDKETASLARRFCVDVLEVDIEQISDLPYPNNFFDVVVFGDVLEHFERPDIVLHRVRKHFRENGRLIASIPNVARIDNRINLLLGNFKYEEDGILSKSHLRFFTKKTAIKLIETSGYKVKDVLYTGLGARFPILPTLLSCQFLICAQVSH